MMDEYSSTRRAGGSTRSMLLAVTGAFALGAALVGYVAWRMNASEEVAQEPAQIAEPAATETAAPSPTPSASESAAAQAVERVAEQQGGIDQRLAAAEQRLARLDLQAEASAGNVARAEGLLIAFATRRAIDKGAELGYLADQLRLRDGAGNRIEQPSPVE